MGLFYWRKNMVKTDSYANTFLSGSDGSEIFGVLGAGAMVPAMLEGLYTNNAIVRRIVDIVPETAIAAGFSVDGLGNEDVFWSRWDELSLSDSITDALSLIHI